MTAAATEAKADIDDTIKRKSFQIFNTPGGRLGDRVKYTLLGAFFNDFLLSALRSHGAPNSRA